MDISRLSTVDLRALQESTKAELKKRQDQEVAKARTQIMAIAQSVGIPLKELIAGASLKVKAGKVAFQFRNPANGDEQWSGRGRKPQWVKSALEAGKTLDALRV